MRLPRGLPRRPDGGFPDPHELGRIAGNLARRYFAHDLTAASSGQVALARAAGLLVYACERWGYTFDAVVEVAEYSVAVVVSGLSSDTRLPQGPRLAHHRSTLAQASARTQLVKLAEILAMAEHALHNCGETTSAPTASSCGSAPRTTRRCSSR